MLNRGNRRLELILAMNPSCRFALSMAVIFGWLCAGMLSAQEQPSLVGQKVMVIKWGAKLGSDKNILLTAQLGAVYQVKKVEGEFLWIPSVGAWIHRGDVVSYDRAIQHFSAAIRRKSTSEAYMHRGVAWHAMGKYDTAIADFDEAIRRDASNSAAYINRGDTWHKKGEITKAIDDYGKAAELKPDDAQAYHHRSVLFTKISNVQKALADANKAIQLAPENSALYNSRGVIYREQKDYQKAIKDYSEAIRLAPRFAAAYANRGFAWKQLQKYHVALADYKKAIEISPNSAETLNDVAWLLATCPDKQLRDGKQATEHARKSCKLSQFSDFNALDTLAAACAQSGEFDEAIEWSQKALELAPEDQRPSIRKRLQLYQSGTAYHEANPTGTSEKSAEK